MPCVVPRTHRRRAVGVPGRDVALPSRPVVGGGGFHGDGGIGRRTSRLGRAATVAAAGLLVGLATGGCVGSVERDELDSMVRARGGGLSGDLVVAGLEAIAGEQGGGRGDVEVLDISLTATTVSYSVRSPRFDDEVDGYTYLLNGDLLGPDPEPNLDDADAVSTFPGDVVDVEVIESAIDDAVERTTVRGGWAQVATWAALPDATFELRVHLTNERADETVVYDADGVRRGTG